MTTHPKQSIIFYNRVFISYLLVELLTRNLIRLDTVFHLKGFGFMDFVILYDACMAVESKILASSIPNFMLQHFQRS